MSECVSECVHRSTRECTVQALGGVAMNDLGALLWLYAVVVV